MSTTDIIVAVRCRRFGDK